MEDLFHYEVEMGKTLEIYLIFSCNWISCFMIFNVKFI